MPVHFVKNPGELHPAGTHVGRISAGILSKQQLMNALEAALQLPADFGQNWDALSDALRDLSWLPAGKISLLHHELPTLSTEDLGAYVRVLEEAFGAGGLGRPIRWMWCFRGAVVTGSWRHSATSVPDLPGDDSRQNWPGLAAFPIQSSESSLH